MLNLSTLFFKVLVPSAAILFYGIRAYGKLKDNNKYRHRSIFILSFVISCSVLVLMMTILLPLWKDVLLIDGKDILLELVSIVLFTPIIVLLFIFQDQIKLRYGLTKRKTNND